MLFNLSFALVFAGIASSYFAWGDVRGTVVLAVYATGAILGQCLKGKENRHLTLATYLPWISLSCLLCVAVIGSIAFYYVTPGKIFGVRTGLLSGVITLVVHIAAIISIKDDFQ